MIEVQVTPIHIVYARNGPKPKRDKKEYGLTATGLNNYRFNSRKQAERIAAVIEKAIRKAIGV